jgi:SAM-dependent methyltransferase
MRFAKRKSDRISAPLEETWALESSWAPAAPGRRYYEIHLASIEEHERTAPILRRLLGSSGRRILEAGCGTGRWMAYFEALGNMPFGIDHSFDQLRFAKSRAPEYPLCSGDVLALPFRDGSFDAAFSSYVAEHFLDGPGAVLAEIHRVLRPGGLLLLAVPFANRWRRLVVYPLFRLLYLLWRLSGGGLELTEYHFGRAELEATVRGAAFDILECHPDDYRPPWSKGLYCDVADILSFMNHEMRRPFQFGRVGTLAVQLASHLPLWWYCEGILVVARARK